jgi:heme exporter protein B
VLSILLTLDGLFKIDYENGFFDHYLLCDYPLFFLIFTRILTHWIIVVLPLVFITPLLGLGFNLDKMEVLILFLSLLCGTPGLCFLGGIGVSLVLTLPRGGVLLTFLVLPFYIPILIFGTSSVLLFNYGLSVSVAQLAVLLLITIFSMLLAPFVIAWAFRASILS